MIPVNLFSLPEKDKLLLIDRWRKGDNTPLNFNPQMHVAHFATCPNASEHHQNKR
jgi:hypothetical protein